MKDKVLIDNYLDVLVYQKSYSEHTIIKYKLIYKEYLTFLLEINKDIKSANLKDLKLFVHMLYNKQYKASTISNYISALKSFYKHLFNENIVKENITVNLHYPKKEKRLYEIIFVGEVKSFFNAIDTVEKLHLRNRAIFLLLYASGIRVSECTNLKIKDLDFEGNFIKVFGKGKKERIVPVSKYVMDEVQTYINVERETLNLKNNSMYLFLNFKGEPITDRGIRYLVDKFCKLGSVNSNITPHKFRHTLATNLLNNGMDLRIIQEILGHETLATTEKYTHVSKLDLQRKYEENMLRD